MRKTVKALAMWSLLLCMSMIFTACQQQTTWQEQYDLGRQYLSESNYEEAIAAFTAAIKIDPKQAPAYVGRGDAYVGLTDSTDDEKLEEALADYEQAVELDENCEEGYLGMAEVYTRQGKLEKVLEILRKGWEITKSWLLGDRLSELEKEEDTELMDPEFGEREGYQAFNTLTETEQNLIRQVLEFLQNDNYTAIEPLVANAGITMDLFTMVDGYKIEFAVGQNLGLQRMDAMLVYSLEEEEWEDNAAGLGIIMQVRPIKGEGYIYNYYQNLTDMDYLACFIKGECKDWQFDGPINSKTDVLVNGEVAEGAVYEVCNISTQGIASNNALEWESGYAEEDVHYAEGYTGSYAKIKEDILYKRNGDRLDQTITVTIIESYNGQTFTYTDTSSSSSPLPVLKTW